MKLLAPLPPPPESVGAATPAAVGNACNWPFAKQRGCSAPSRALLLLPTAKAGTAAHSWPDPIVSAPAKSSLLRSGKEKLTRASRRSLLDEITAVTSSPPFTEPDMLNSLSRFVNDILTFSLPPEWPDNSACIGGDDFRPSTPNKFPTSVLREANLRAGLAGTRSGMPVHTSTKAHLGGSSLKPGFTAVEDSVGKREEVDFISMASCMLNSSCMRYPSKSLASLPNGFSNCTAM
mmetsp:Transcript_86171/g.216862  ORF Transcript_86171/g.216862 Transcript_86171/m.216862 type:complete len:234 (+) Transcript_86171:240-941(+)